MILPGCRDVLSTRVPFRGIGSPSIQHHVRGALKVLVAPLGRPDRDVVSGGKSAALTPAELNP